MFSEKLLSLLRNLSKVELNRFRKFLLSPYLNDQPELLRLFDLCDAAMRKGPAQLEKLDKTSVWENLYPNEGYDDARLRRLASDLTQLGLRFLALESQPSKPIEEALDMQEVLGKPGLEKHLDGIERQIAKLLAAEPGKSAQFYQYNFRQHQNILNRASRIVASGDYIEKLWPANFYLDCFYIILKLKYYVSWLVFKGFRSTTRELNLLPGLWEHLSDERFSGVPLIGIYRHIILCLTEPEQEAHFKSLLNSLEQNSRELSREDLRECYQIAQNYCAFKINQGKTEYYAEAFEIVKNIIREGILLENNHLQEGMYKNIITFGLRTGNYAWAEDFIKNYSVYLPANIRDNALSYNLANLYLQQKKYDDVIGLLQSVEYSDVVYSLGSKLMLSMTYYEKNEYAPLDALMDSFRIYLRRNQVISKEVKREYTNYLNLLKKLTNARRGAATNLKRQIQESKALTAKKWLLEKVEELL